MREIKSESAYKLSTNEIAKHQVRGLEENTITPKSNFVASFVAIPNLHPNDRPTIRETHYQNSKIINQVSVRLTLPL